MIQADQLTKRFGERTAVDRMSFTVAAGELYALLGGNGAGKTTTLSLLLGLLAPDDGRALIDGQQVGPGARPRAAFVPEVVDLYPDLDPMETLAFFCGVAGLSRSEEDFERALTNAGLDSAHYRRRLRVFSKGMRQKVALAVAEVQGAKAIFLDEPTSGLDPTAAEQLMERLVHLKGQGAAILMSTHDVLQVSRVADRVGILKDGKMACERTIAQMQEENLIDLYREVVTGEKA